MGRPIKKKWFSARTGSADGDLQLATENGAFTIKAQKGTSKYLVNDPAISTAVKLVDGDAADNTEARLQHDGKNVRKITQYQMYYFDNTSAMWNDGSGNAVGTFIPALFVEGGVQAVLGAVGNTAGVIDSIVITNGGAGYVGGENVTISGGTATGPFAILVDGVDGSGAITSFNFVDGGATNSDADGAETASVPAPQ